MKTTTSDGRDKGTININQQSLLDFQEGVVQAAMVVMTMLVALIGVWGLLSLCSGIVMGGGIVEMAKGWLSSVGM